MAKLHKLTISVNYVPNWDIWHGLREILQNARDAEIEHDAKMAVEWKKRRVNGRDSGGLIITSDGATMPLKALLLGHTSKSGDSRTIGQYGEGLKLGLISLLRKNIQVKIRNGSEVWEPEIIYDEDFGERILAVRVSEGRKSNNRVSFEILGVDKSFYEQAIERCLFLQPPLATVSCNSGEILLDPDKKGMVFVKGIFVGKEDLNYGYNFAFADIDRDRRMLSDLYNNTSKCLTEALNQGQMVNAIYEMMASGQREALNLRYLSWQFTEEAKKSIAEQFDKLHPDAIPVTNENQRDELSHFGARGVVVNGLLADVLSLDEEKSFSKTMDRLKFSAEKEFLLCDLEQNEQENFVFALNTVHRAACACHMTFRKDRCLIVEFADENLCGTYDPKDQSVRISRKCLASKSDTMRILIHEIAHEVGKDGHKAHEAMIGKITKHVFAQLLNEEI